MTIPVFSMFVVACTTTNNKEQDFSSTNEGLEYRLCTIGDSSETIKTNDWVLLSAVFRTNKDSIFWNSNYFTPQGLIMQVRRHVPGSFINYLTEMVPGDSMVFRVEPMAFFQSVFESPVPGFVKSGEKIIAHVKIISRISNPDDIGKFLTMPDVAVLERREDSLLKNYVDKKFLNSSRHANGMWYKIDSSGNGPAVAGATSVWISYEGRFLDDQIVDVTPKGKVFEWRLREMDQLIPGLEHGVRMMHEGDIWKFVLPSYLAFGREGSSNGSVPPNTPLVYKVKIESVQK